MVCGVCEAVGAAISSEWHSDVDLGTAEEIRDRSLDCSICREILESFNTYRGAVRLESNPRVTFCQESLSVYSVKFTKNELLNFGGSYMVKDGPLTLGLVLNSCFINLKRIREWLDFCDKHHGGSCHGLSPSQKIEPMEKLLLVDVDRGCLVHMPGTTRYCALSYVWGQLSGSIETRLENIDFLKQEGSLIIAAGFISLPKTIGDTIRLLRTIGQRYLWIDRLSIIQNDQENKHLYISRMDTIFANAYLTVIAADGEDADFDLSGVGLGSRPRTCSQSIIKFPQVSLVTPIDYHETSCFTGAAGHFKNGFFRLERSYSSMGRFTGIVKNPSGLKTSLTNRIVWASLVTRLAMYLGGQLHSLLGQTWHVGKT